MILIVLVVVAAAVAVADVVVTMPRPVVDQLPQVVSTHSQSRFGPGRVGGHLF